MRGHKIDIRNYVKTQFIYIRCILSRRLICRVLPQIGFLNVGFFIILLATVGSIVSSLLTGSGKGICLVTVQLRYLIACTSFFSLDIQAEERLAMVEERRTLTEQKMGLEREIKKQEKAAQDMILNKNRNNREKLVFGFKSKGAL